ncbi:hypothetical protein GC170_20490 [bacterium]|nr:hypothetical protein [bacterium]
MDLQTSALLIIALLVLISIIYFSASRFSKIATGTGIFTKITASCYRIPIAGTTDKFTYKVGFLLLSSKTILKSDIKMVTATLGSTSGVGTFEIKSKTSSTIPPVTTYYLNAVCPIKKTLTGPEFPVYNTPGSELTFSFRIDFSDNTNEVIDPIVIIPIDIEPC